MRVRRGNKNWVREKAFRNQPLMNKHHIIPKHHGGKDSPLITVTTWEHAQLHKDIYENGYDDGVTVIESGCTECLKNYKTLMGLHETWKTERDFYHDNEFDIIHYYEKDVNSEDILRNIDEDIITHDCNNIEDTDCVDMDTEINMESLKIELGVVLDKLKDRERDVIIKNFGLDGNDRLNLWQIGDLYGLTRERTRLIRNLAIKRLRQNCLPIRVNTREGISFETIGRYRRLVKLLESFSK